MFFLFKLYFNYWKWFLTFVVLVNNTADYHFWNLFIYLFLNQIIFIFDFMI